MRAKSGGGWLSAGVWTGAVLLWLAPLVAMQVTPEVKWTVFDFAVFGVMLISAAGAFEVTVRLTGNGAYRAAMGLAILAAFLLVWVNLAVGFIGDEGNPANLMYAALPGTIVIGGIAARFRAHGMAWTMVAVAVGQALAGVIGVVGLGAESLILLPTAIFVALWLISAWLFGRANRARLVVGA